MGSSASSPHALPPVSDSSRSTGAQYPFQDLTYSPDFPSVEQAIAGLYPQVGGVHIDGAMVFDPYALAALVHFTRPHYRARLLPALTYTNGGAEILLKGQYTSNPDAN